MYKLILVLFLLITPLFSIQLAIKKAKSMAEKKPNPRNTVAKRLNPKSTVEKKLNPKPTRQNQRLSDAQSDPVYPAAFNDSDGNLSVGVVVAS